MPHCGAIDFKVVQHPQGIWPKATPPSPAPPVTQKNPPEVSGGFGQLKLRSDQARSKTQAIPWPPPIHIVTRQYLPPTRSNSYNALVAMKAPEQPTG